MADIAELKRLIEEQGRTWEQFRAANDERLKQIEAKGSADAALVAKVENLNAELTKIQNRMAELDKDGKISAALDRMNERMDEIEARAQRAALGAGGQPAHPVLAEHRRAFQAFMRQGEEKELRALERKVLEVRGAVTIGTDSEGGYAVPEELDRQIHDLLVEISPMRQIANVVTVGTPAYRKLVNTRGATSGWVGETTARTVTDTPALAEVKPFWGEIYANPQTTQHALDDIFFNVEAWLAAEVQTEFAYQEGVAFVSGDGSNKPKGFLAYTATSDADGVRAFGSIQYIASGVAAALSDATHPLGDTLISVVHTLKAGHRQNARWAMNSLTTAAVRKEKDSEGNYLWRPGLEAGQPSTLLGYPVVEMEAMPDVAANALPIAFGDFRAGYTIVDRVGIRVLRDPFSNKPYVGFYTTKRVGGMLVDSEAIKVVKVATS